MYNGHNTIGIFPVSDTSDLKKAREICSEICLSKGFGNIGIKELLLSLSEACTNILRYAKPGKVYFINPPDGRGLTIRISDDGPGIDDITTAMQDGYTTCAGSLGVGLGVMKRAVDKFTIESQPGKGTSITITKYVKYFPRYDFAVVSHKDSRYHHNGDICYLTDIYGDRILVAIIDGLGEGEDAERSSRKMYNFIEQHKYLDLPEIIVGMHNRMIREKLGGGAISLMTLKGNTIKYAGVGDTFGLIFPQSDKRLKNSEGIVGQFSLPGIEISNIQLREGKFIVVLCTDGIKNKFMLSELDFNLSARVLAEEIIREFKRDFGDATVFVIKGEVNA